jgi:uncharacterized protein (TIGR01777 family)
MRVLITGATGLIGEEIVKQCHARHIDVNYLTTSRSKIEQRDNYKGFYWNPKTSDINLNCFDDVEVIINLSGTPIAKRWTTNYKAEILSSRIDALDLLYNSIKNENFKIKHIVSASAVGIYPDSLTHYYDEDFEISGDGFLTNVSKQWEARVKAFHNLNLQVSIIRIGIVLAKQGGALPQLAKPILYGFGSAIGNGEQWQSWIHIEDLGALFLHVISESLYGVYNGVAPNAVQQKEFVKTIAKVLGRPLFLPPIPASLLKIVLGEMSALVLESQHVSSRKVEHSGYNFKFHNLEPALHDLLKAW